MCLRQIEMGGWDYISEHDHHTYLVFGTTLVMHVTLVLTNVYMVSQSKEIQPNSCRRSEGEKTRSICLERIGVHSATLARMKVRVH